MATAAPPEIIPDGFEWDGEDERLISGKAHEMSEKGDTTIKWDKRNQAEVDVAKASFETLVEKKKFAAFSVTRGGEKGTRITEFDPDAERILLVPPMQGG